MYSVKTISGKGFSIDYPTFDSEDTANRFYETFAEAVKDYFSDLTEHHRCICRCKFTAEEGDGFFTVKIRLTCRRMGEPGNSKSIVHRWKKWQGRDSLLEKQR